MIIMARLIKSDLSISNKIADFDVKVRDGVTIVGGNSATGKTLFFKEKQLHSQRHNDDSYIFINYGNKQEFNRIIAENPANKIIFVDNADIIVPHDISVYRAIRNSSCQFIFFGRDITRYDKNYDNWAELKEGKAGKFKLSYVFKKTGKVWQ